MFFIRQKQKKKLVIMLILALLSSSIVLEQNAEVSADTTEVRYSSEGWEYIVLDEEKKTAKITGMTYDGKEAYEYKLTVPSEVEGYQIIGLDDECFESDSSLLEVTISEGVNEIGENAFAHCEELQKVSLPDTLAQLGSCAFSGCSSLTEVKISETFVYSKFEFQNTPWYEEKKQECQNGLVIIADTVIDQVNCSGEVRIPEGIKKIDKYVFEDNEEITKVVLPESIEEIGASSFKNCTALAEITFPEGLTTINRTAFGYCAALEEIVFPKTIKKVDTSAFIECTSLKKVTLPDNSNSNAVSAFAFTNRSGMQFVVPEEHTLGSYWVRYYTEISYLVAEGSVSEEVVKNFDLNYETYDAEIELEEGQFRSEDGYWLCEILSEEEGTIELKRMMAKGIKDITDLTIPTQVDGYKVVKIGEGFCRENQWLEQVVIPEGVQSVEQYAFAECPKLKKAIFPEKSIDYISRHVFFQCAELEEIIFPKTIGNLGEIARNTPWLERKEVEREDHLVIVSNWVMSGTVCTGDIEIPEGVTGVGENAFSDSEITGISFPASLQYVGDYSFSGCGKLEKISFAEKSEELSFGKLTFLNCASLKEVRLPYYFRKMESNTFFLTNIILWIPKGMDVEGSELKEAEGIFFYVPEGSAAETYMKQYVASENYATYQIENENLTPTPTPISSARPVPVVSASPTVAPIPSIKPTPVVSASPTVTPIPSIKPTPVVSASPTVTPIPSIKPTPVVNSSPTATPIRDLQPIQMTTESANLKVVNREKNEVAREKIYVIKGLKYQKQSATTVTFVGAVNKKRKTLIVPDVVKIKEKRYRVVAVGKNACKSYKKLRKVKLGKYITKVQDGAFEKCINLREITFGIRVQEIGKCVLKKNRKLKRIIFKTKKLKKIGKQVFKGVPGSVVIRTPKSKLKKYKKMIRQVR